MRTVRSMPTDSPSTDCTGAAPDAIAATLKAHGLRAGYFLAVGTLQPRKNMGRLLEAYLGLPASTRDPARFSFAHGGKDGFPYPVDTETYDRTVETLRQIVAVLTGDLAQEPALAIAAGADGLMVEVHPHPESALSDGDQSLSISAFDSLMQAGQFVQVIEQRQGIKIACLEEIAWRNGWISAAQLAALAQPMGNSSYGNYLRSLAAEIA